MITKSIVIPIYLGKLHVIISDNFLTDIVAINKKYKQGLTEKDYMLGYAQRRGGHLLVYINVEKHKELFKSNSELEIIGTIAHEAVHLCNMLFLLKGVTLHLKKDEPQAYLTEWFTKEIYKVYLKSKSL